MFILPHFYSWGSFVTSLGSSWEGKQFEIQYQVSLTICSLSVSFVLNWVIMIISMQLSATHHFIGNSWTFSGWSVVGKQYGRVSRRPPRPLHSLETVLLGVPVEGGGDTWPGWTKTEGSSDGMPLALELDSAALRMACFPNPILTCLVFFGIWAFWKLWVFI